MTRVEERIGGFVARWVVLATRRPAATVAIAFALTALALGYTATHLKLNSDTEAMLSDDLPFRQVSRALEAVFPSPARTLFILVEADSSEGARNAADELAGRLRARSNLFESVFHPGGPFFRERALLYPSTEELEDLADRLLTAQPFVAKFARDPSLVGVADLLVRAIDGDGQTLAVGDARTRELAAELEAALAQSGSALPWERWLLGEASEREGRRRVLQVVPIFDFEALQPAGPALEALSQEVAALAPEAGLRVRVTGDAALSAEEMERVADQAALAGLGSFLAVAALLWLALRSPYAVLAVLLTLITGLIWTAAFAALAIGHLNLVSVTFAVLFIGLGVDFGLHLAMRYLERLERGDSVHTALAHAAQSTGTSLVVCAITTAIGFYSFLPTPYSGVAELGAISGTGMLLSLVATLTLLPALLVLAPAARRGSRAPDAHGPGSDASWPARNARPVLMASGIAALAGLALLPAIRFDANPLAVRDPGAESVQTMQDLLATSRLSPWPIELLAADEATAHDLASRLGSLPQVERTVTVAEFVPGEQVEKLEILRDVTLFMGELDVAPTSPVDVDATLDALRRLRGALTRYEREAGTRLAESARTLDAAIADVIDRTEAAADPGADLGQLQERVLGRLRGIVVWLAQALDPPPTSIDDLPADLRSRYVAADGRLRLQVFPAVDLGDSEGLIAFVDAVREIVPEAGGSAVTIVESGRAIVSSLRMAMTGALLAITLLLLALWRSLALAALVVGPLLLAALLTISGAVLAGLPLNFANVIVIPLLLGMGVDSGIHLVRRFTGGDGSGDLLRTSTARAVLFSALTTVASFGTLGLASHRGMASLGQLLALGMGFVLVANLIVLPALLQVLRKRL